MTEAAMAIDDERETETEPRRCPGITKDGTPCRVPSEMLLSSGWCLLHDPARGADRVGNAVLGGRKAGATRRKGLDESELGELRTPEDAQRWTATIAAAVATGRLSSAQGRTVLVAVQAWLRAHEQNVVAKQIADLQAARDRRRYWTRTDGDYWTSSSRRRRRSYPTTWTWRRSRTTNCSRGCGRAGSSATARMA